MTFQEATEIAIVAINNCHFIKDSCRIEARNVIKTALAESPTTNLQQPHGAEPTEICPRCKGEGVERGPSGYVGTCKCGGSGKLHHA